MVKLRPAFIVGFPKSGTTLLQRALDGHPELVVDDYESKFFTRFVPAAGPHDDLATRLDLAERVMFRKLIPEHPVRHESWDYDSIWSRFTEEVSQPAAEVRDYLPAAIKAIAAESGQLTADSRVWVEKTPYYRAPRRLLDKWYPECLILQNVRDPRANYAALVANGMLGHREDVGWFAHHWRRDVRLARMAGERIFGNRQLVISYDAFVTDPEAHLEEICRHLGIDFHHSLQSPTTGGGDRVWGGNSAYGDSFRTISTTSRDRWREILAAEDIATIEAVAGDEMVALGYELTDHRAEVNRAALRAKYIYFEGRRYASMAKNAPRATFRRLRLGIS